MAYALHEGVNRHDRGRHELTKTCQPRIAPNATRLNGPTSRLAPASTTPPGSAERTRSSPCRPSASTTSQRNAASRLTANCAEVEYVADRNARSTTPKPRGKAERQPASWERNRRA